MFNISVRTPTLALVLGYRFL